MSQATHRVGVLYDASDPADSVVLKIDTRCGGGLTRDVWISEAEAYLLLSRIADALLAIQNDRTPDNLSVRPTRGRALAAK